MLQKRFDYGFNGYQVPPIPRATRSARVSRSALWIRRIEFYAFLCSCFWDSALIIVSLLAEKRYLEESR